MQPPDEFFTLYRGLAREGPGLPDDVIWALQVAGTADGADICDAGCGSGADAVTLAKARPRARISALDIAPSLVVEARVRLAPFGARARVAQGDMAHLPGRYDLIWCAGAAYFLGLATALRGWRPALKTGGRVAISHPVHTTMPPSDAARAFWQGEPCQVSDIAGIEAEIAAAGFATLGHRLLIGAPWAAYYGPLAARIEALRAAQPSPALAGVLDASAREIALWRAAPDQIAYALVVVEPR